MLLRPVLSLRAQEDSAQGETMDASKVGLVCCFILRRHMGVSETRGYLVLGFL